ncbi:MAG: tRNA preQ1(34) S-adenosylmethionine ribosyltransferase-isomerase QueA [Phycisphaerales bacterium]|nr:tRNA preQ1(34) S-adenosylmethionine ribosyltransferase-isomerase QueA [Phycisphaerales bacterium]
MPVDERQHVLRTSDLDYPLPQELVAIHPVSPRDAARLLVLGGEGLATRHLHVRDLPELLRAGDLLVLNSTRVLPARFIGTRTDTGGKVEGLFVSVWRGETGIVEEGSDETQLRWSVMLKARRTRPRVRISLSSHGGGASGVELELLSRAPGPEGVDSGEWLVNVHGARSGEHTVALLERIGLTPLPPYIRQARKGENLGTGAAARNEPTDAGDSAVYQTVFADASPPVGHDAVHDVPGSVAAPTAGLHFTPELLSRLEARGVRSANVTLHVGLGTFKPVETEFVEQHPMHAEWCHIPEGTCRAVRETRARGGRVIAVGTTSARTLESFGSLASCPVEGLAAWTRLLVTPGYRFKHVSGLLTNFHLPRTTLLALVAAITPCGVERLMQAYREAMGERYRVFSYGDAMLVLPSAGPLSTGDG